LTGSSPGTYDFSFRVPVLASFGLHASPRPRP
jgi:hypothetical protein